MNKDFKIIIEIINVGDYDIIKVSDPTNLTDVNTEAEDYNEY